MKRFTYVLALLALAAAIVMSGVFTNPQPEVMAQAAPAAPPPATPAQTPAISKSTPDNPGCYAGEAGLDASERAGREIWYKATAGNARFHTYVFQQRINVLIAWYRVLNAKERDDRFAAWGRI